MKTKPATDIAKTIRNIWRVLRFSGFRNSVKRPLFRTYQYITQRTAAGTRACAGHFISASSAHSSSIRSKPTAPGSSPEVAFWRPKRITSAQN